MKYKILLNLIALGFLIAITQASAYDITVNNQAVTFDFINKTCNGGRIDYPPKQLPTDQTIIFTVQNDTQQGCMLRYDDGKGGILGIWIHQHQVDCSNEGTVFSYQCTFRNDTLKIDK